MREQAQQQRRMMSTLAVVLHAFLMRWMGKGDGRGSLQPSGRSSQHLEKLVELAKVLWTAPGLHLRLLVRALSRSGGHLGVGLGRFPVLRSRRDVVGLGDVALAVLVWVVRLERADSLSSMQVVCQQVLANVVHSANINDGRHLSFLCGS